MKTNKGILLLAVVLALGAAAYWAGRSAAPSAAAQVHERYQCPMHPQIVRDHPGDCPICHMHLEKVLDDGSEAPASGAPPVPGKAGFTLSPARQQLIGVRTSAAELRPLVRTLRLPGRVLSQRRVLAQLLEIDAGALKPGMKARLRGPGGQESAARVTDVDGGIDSLTHSFGVALQSDAAAAWMRQGVFCEALVEAPLGRRLVLPLEAVLDTGERQVVFVADGKGHFEPRQVQLGESGDDGVEVTRGIKAGELVVTSANFLIDSESRFQAALSNFGSQP